jgi:hypothetical protein
MVSGAFLRQLYSISVAQSASLPSSKMSVSCYQELLVLVWKLLEQNVPFRLHFVKNEDVLQLIVPVLILMHEYRRDAAKLALMHHMAAMLLMLSGERDAAVQLNRPLVMRLPIDLPLAVGTATFADLFVMVVCHVVGGGRVDRAHAARGAARGARQPVGVHARHRAPRRARASSACSSASCRRACCSTTSARASTSSTSSTSSTTSCSTTTRAPPT